MHLKYRKEIDGLRAIAVMAVILFHAGVKPFGGGFVGVDVFFVISGYLITSIILGELALGSFTLAGFYDRRLRRILPPLFLVMLVCIPFAWFWLLPEDLKSFSKSLVSVSLFSSNIQFWSEKGYFDTLAGLKPLLHTWSLGVEEQYYLLFPAFLLLAWRFCRRHIVMLLAVVAVASLAAAQWAAIYKPAAAFYFLPTRSWELLVGSFIAIYLSRARDDMPPTLATQSLGAAGLGLIAFSVLAFTEETPFPGFYAAVPAVGAALVILFGNQATLVGRLLSNRVLVGIGLISYGLYLWHHPVFAFARLRTVAEPDGLRAAALVALTFLCAFLSWKYVERPFRNRTKVSRRSVFAFAAAGSLFFCAVGLTGYLLDGFKGRLFANGRSAQYLEEKIGFNYGLARGCDGHLAGGFTLSADCRTSTEPEILLWGDSYAKHLVQGLQASNPSAKFIQLTMRSCAPVFGVGVATNKSPVSDARECSEFNDGVKKWVLGNKSVKYAVLSGSFAHYLEPKNRLLIDGRLAPASKEAMAAEFEKTLAFLRGRGITPVIFSHLPTNGTTIGRCLAKSEMFGADPDECNFALSETPPAIKRSDVFLKQMGEKTKVVFFPDWLCPGGLCKTHRAGTFFYMDDLHLSREGSALLGKERNFYREITSRPAPIEASPR
ncbi:MAG: acyltransferase family protein [Elusimicrobiales bacterium]